MHWPDYFSWLEWIISATTWSCLRKDEKWALCIYQRQSLIEYESRFWAVPFNATPLFHQQPSLFWTMLVKMKCPSFQGRSWSLEENLLWSKFSISYELTCLQIDKKEENHDFLKGTRQAKKWKWLPAKASLQSHSKDWAADAAASYHPFISWT